MPAILKILLVFAGMLGLARLRLQIGAAVILGGLVLNLWAGVSPPDTAANFGRSLLHAELWLLIAITVLIVEVGRFLTEKENADKMVAAVSRWGGRHGRAATLMAMPAVIGLAPMPAGALFSAPFVKQAGETMEGRPDWQTAVNYWFRHVWEYWWPLYPGVIVAMSIFEMDPRRFIGIQFLFTPVAVAAGYFFLIRPNVRGLAAAGAPEGGRSRDALRLLLPIAAVVLALFLVPAPLASLFPRMGLSSRKMLAVVIGLFVGVAVVFVQEKERRRMFTTVLKPKSVSVLVSLGGILVFKFLLGTSGLLPLAGKELTESGIPLVLAVATLPFLAGLVTGLAVGFAGAALPLVVGLMAAEGSGLTPASTLVLAYGFGYAGMILSPVHLCLLVTKDYFGASLRSVYRHVLPCVVTIMLYAVVAHVVLRVL